MVAISIELPPEEALKAVLESPYTRYPVYRETLDDIVGVLHVRDLIEAMHDRGIASSTSRRSCGRRTMVPETKDLGALLTEFRRTNQHMAIVIDEYGSMEGIVTLEDLLEEIVGEIEDEFDLPDETVERIDEDTIRIDGTFPIDDFNEQFALRPAGRGLPHGRRLRLRRSSAARPSPGDEVSHDGLRFQVDSVEGQRIDRLTVTFQPWHHREGPDAGNEPADD